MKHEHLQILKSLCGGRHFGKKRSETEYSTKTSERRDESRAARLRRFLERDIPLRRRLSHRQLSVLCRQLSFALESGMPLPSALALLGAEIGQPLCRTFLVEVEKRVRQGKTLAQAIGESGVEAPPVLLEFVLAGEQSGALAQTLGQAADYFQKQYQLRQMLGAALFYPLLLLLLMAAALAAMCLFVVPAIVQTYDNFQAELPPLTRALLAAADWISRYRLPLILAVILLAALGVYALARSLRREEGRARWKAILLRLPVAGRLYQQYWFIQISQALGLMLSGGMLLVHSLRTLRQIYRRSLFASELEELWHSVADGHSFGAGLAACSFVPRMAGELLAVSEQTGALADGLLQLCGYYQQQLQQRLQTLTALLEPSLVILLGLAVLALAGGLFLPLVQSYQYLL